jgi:hypothetical protein
VRFSPEVSTVFSHVGGLGNSRMNQLAGVILWWFIRNIQYRNKLHQIAKKNFYF